MTDETGDDNAATPDQTGARGRSTIEFPYDDPTLFHFLLFVQHGQLSKLGADTPTPVTVMHGVLSRAIDAGEIPAQNVNLAVAFAMGIALQPMTFAAYGRLPQAQAPNAERLIAAAWAAVTTV